MTFSDSDHARLADAVSKATMRERWHVGWHLKKEIQIPHLLGTITLAASAFWYVAKLDQRIALMEAHAQQQKERDDRQDKLADEQLRLLRADLYEIKQRLDRLIDRERAKP